MKKVYEKLNYWESESLRLKGVLKEEDPVWLSWRSLLQSFKLSMKWIEKLASDTFSVSILKFTLFLFQVLFIKLKTIKNDHFSELFAAIGLVYDPETTYTVNNLIDFNLGDYTDLINLIFKRSNVESDNISQFNSIYDLWTTKLKFNLGKNFPIQLYKKG